MELAESTTSGPRHSAGRSETPFSECSLASCTSQEPMLRRKPGTQVLLKLDAPTLGLITFVPPVFALGFAFLVGFLFDYDKLLNYEWTCGKVLLPSISRIINLPKERVVYNFAVLWHAGLRPVQVLQNYFICRFPARSPRFTTLFQIGSTTLLSVGILEVVFAVLLTVVGERESGPLHVVFFSGFIVCCCSNFILTTVFFRNSMHFARRILKAYQSLRLKLMFLALTVTLAPAITLFFMLYWQYCVNFGGLSEAVSK